MFDDSGHIRPSKRIEKRPFEPAVTLHDLLDGIRDVYGEIESVLAEQRELRAEMIVLREIVDQDR
jgi:hypothetical protein